MTVHILTEEVMLQSHVIITAPPGERSTVVASQAKLEIDRVLLEQGLSDEDPSSIHMMLPTYKEGRKWHVRAVTRFKKARLLEIR